MVEVARDVFDLHARSVSDLPAARTLDRVHH
jgi:hypothetical protein